MKNTSLDEKHVSPDAPTGGVSHPGRPLVEVLEPGRIVTSEENRGFRQVPLVRLELGRRLSRQDRLLVPTDILDDDTHPSHRDRSYGEGVSLRWTLIAKRAISFGVAFHSQEKGAAQCLSTSFAVESWCSS